MAGLSGSGSPRAAALPALDCAFVLSPLGGLMCAQAVLGLLVWTLIADTTYYLHAAYSWVMFVSIFFWIVTVLFFMTYLLQLQLKFYMVPWSLVLMIFNTVATVLYITAFIVCAAAVQPTSWRQWDYNRRAVASVSSSGQGKATGPGSCCAYPWPLLLFQFFACLTMVAYGVSTFFSFRAWKGLGSNAATSQVTDHA
ncbi:plasmolipin isoform X1 [Melopsittacus undulatus]|uniref:plasmolipin isoform X1 n=1 Tax=Melopsittacus undulatus TaxID=13146 RepID=UPI00146DFAF1|nr:plasmolipin isoform X1 [Melopsittacus undulatus]